MTVTVNSAPTAGQSVTTSLSNGYAFQGGSATNTQVSGSDGRVNLPAINVPAQGGNSTITATVGVTASSTSTIQAASTSKAVSARGGSGTITSAGGGSKFTSVPSTAVPVGGWGYYLDGTNLWYFNSILATNVTSAKGGSWDGTDYVYYVQNGVAKNIAGGNGAIKYSATFASVPSTAVPVGGWGYYLDGTDLWYFNSIIATGVTHAIGESNEGVDYISYIQNGVAKNIAGGNGAIKYSATFASVPSTAVPVGGWGYYLDGTNLWYFNSILATNVTSAKGGNWDGTDYVYYVQNGVAKNIAGGNGAIKYSATFASVPSTAVPVGGWGYYLDGTDLWYFNSIIATGVTHAIGESNKGDDYIYYMTASC